MIQFSAVKWFWLGYALENLTTDCLLKPGVGDTTFNIGLLHTAIAQPTLEKARECLNILHVECNHIGLAVSAQTTAEIIQSLDSQRQSPQYQWLRNQFGNLQSMIRKELQTKVFFYVSPEKVRYLPTMDKQNLFGEKVGTSFPSVKLDADEAGICLATARATACVFHLMRVLEIGLTALGAVFGVSLAHTNWAPAIEQIESRVREMHKDSKWKAMPDWKDQQEFYSQAASHFGILKDAWRNYTAHARGTYTEESAALIFENVGAFMKTLAGRLHE